MPTKILGMELSEGLEENQQNANVLEIRDVDGFACVFVNGTQIYEVNPEIKISTNRRSRNKGVEVTLNFYAAVNIEK